MIGEEINSPEAIYFYVPVLVVIIGNILLFLFCQIKEDNSYIDTFWGISFITPMISLAIILSVNGKEIHPRQIVVFFLNLIWAMRLAIHIASRHNGEDFRYAEFRRDWMEGGLFSYYIQAFFKVFMLQAVFSILINAASLYVCIYTATNRLIWLDFIGVAVWLFGFVFEVVGDEQLKTHLADKSPNKEKFIKWGLWRYTRHPNYFGEAVLWYGIWLIACSLQYGWITVFSPLFINILIRYVSGVPLLEKKYKNNEEFQQYCKETNVFVPWCPDIQEKSYV